MDTTVTEAIEKHGTKRENLIPVIQYIAAKDKWLCEDVLEEIAGLFKMSMAEVHGVVTFYSFLDTEPRGKFIIRICRTISCDMAGKEDILEALRGNLRIENGETTADSLFTLLETNCIGWCHKGPAMLINDDIYTELTADKAIEIIESYRNKELQ